MILSKEAGIGGEDLFDSFEEMMEANGVDPAKTKQGGPMTRTDQFAVGVRNCVIVTGILGTLALASGYGPTILHTAESLHGRLTAFVETNHSNVGFVLLAITIAYLVISILKR